MQRLLFEHQQPCFELVYSVKATELIVSVLGVQNKLSLMKLVGYCYCECVAGFTELFFFFLK